MSAMTATPAYESGTPMTNVHIHDPDYAKGSGVGGSMMQAGRQEMYKEDVLAQSMPGVSIFLRPYAAPSCLGFAAFFAANWTLSTWYCDWYGSLVTPGFIAPFIMMMGIAEIFAALWCYPARDTTGTVFHGVWGSLFLAWSVVQIMVSQLLIVPYVWKWGGSDEFAMWLVTCAAITGAICLVTLPRDILISSVALMQFIGAVLIFSGHFEDGDEDSARRLIKAGGYFWMFGSLVALLRSAIYCLPQLQQDEYTDIISSKAYRGQARVAVPIGEPGVRKGQ